MKALWTILAVALLSGCTKEKLPPQVITFDTNWLNARGKEPATFIHFYRTVDTAGKPLDLYHSENIIAHLVTNGWTMLPAVDGVIAFRRESAAAVPMFEQMEMR